MGILIAIVLIIGFCSFFISRAVYRVQVKNAYKSPLVTATIIFILAFAALTAGIFFLVVNNISISR